MAFHDVQLPTSISRRYIGGPSFLTSIVASLSGIESRNINWSLARGNWRLGYPLDETQYADVRAFFYARAGAAHSFRYKDWGDYKLGDTTTDTRQFIWVGDAAVVDFPIYKQYSSGGIDYNRTLTKIVAGTTRVWLDAVEQVSGWTVGLLTGIITFTVAPGVGVNIFVLTEFDCAARFGVDNLEVDMFIEPLASIPSIPITEVKGE